ncbi:hypothetical protein AVEN_266932-1 [Araneus ventricosus]|uniref:Uncharacterized protein n=1 Tax=Araneus ventricosus TaxID=182803 RepID=A0A4Y2DE72_ARAVE|nr:hypothetical protein AVEN_266932-1 [Araneus ventricosus]
MEVGRYRMRFPLMVMRPMIRSPMAVWDICAHARKYTLLARKCTEDCQGVNINSSLECPILVQCDEHQVFRIGFLIQSSAEKNRVVLKLPKLGRRFFDGIGYRTKDSPAPTPRPYHKVTAAGQFRCRPHHLAAAQNNEVRPKITFDLLQNGALINSTKLNSRVKDRRFHRTSSAYTGLLNVKSFRANSLPLVWHGCLEKGILDQASSDQD